MKQKGMTKWEHQAHGKKGAPKFTEDGNKKRPRPAALQKAQIRASQRHYERVIAPAKRARKRELSALIGAESTLWG